MPLSPTIEHFCTLFDSGYLPHGLTLHASLMRHAQPFHLSILCMDGRVKQQLERLNLDHVTLIDLPEIETPELLAVKPTRSRGEYCWTLTPFSFQCAFQRHPEAHRVTYLDADLFFYDDPRHLLRELDTHEKSVLITDHAYAPEYDQSTLSGRFCVQFLTISQTESALAVMRWWQQRCLEWCFDRVEEGKFGDQKYLDAWPALFSEVVHICQQTQRTLAPWNVRHVAQQHPKLEPVFFHFHSLKLMQPNQLRLHYRYRIGQPGLKLYEQYYATFRAQLQRMVKARIPIPMAPAQTMLQRLKSVRQVLLRETRFQTIQGL